MQKRARLGRPTLYDWDALIRESTHNGIEHDFVQGRDFACTPISFGSLVRRTARVREVAAVVSVDGDHVYFCFVKEA